ILWPELFRPFGETEHESLLHPIRWINYADYGDPVGFELDSTRQWLRVHGYSARPTPCPGDKPLREAFIFDDADDVNFYRYLLPGKAHVAYWQDAQVFGHFITEVILKEKGEAPPDKTLVRTASRVGAYLVPLLLLLAAVYL